MAVRVRLGEDSGGMSPFLIGHPALRVFAEGDLTRSWIDVVIAKQIGSDRGDSSWASPRSKLFERCLPSGSHQAAAEHFGNPLPGPAIQV